MVYKFNVFTGNFDDVRDLSGYVPYTGATTNVDLGDNDLTVDTDILFVDSSNDRVGIMTDSPRASLHDLGSFATISTVVDQNTLLGDKHHSVLVTGEEPIIISLPSVDDVHGRQYFIKNIGEEDVRIDPKGDEKIDGEEYWTLGQMEAVIIVASDDQDHSGWFIFGEYNR